MQEQPNGRNSAITEVACGNNVVQGGVILPFKSWDDDDVSE